MTSHPISTLFRVALVYNVQPLCTSAYVWSHFSPTHSSLGWPPLSPSPVWGCCLAAGLNSLTVYLPLLSVLSNVLLIRWLNYSCKNNVGIGLTIAVCQILLASLEAQPLLPNSWNNRKPLLNPAVCPSFPSPLVPPKLFVWLWAFFSLPFTICFMSHTAFQTLSKRPNNLGQNLVCRQISTQARTSYQVNNRIHKKEGKNSFLFSLSGVNYTSFISLAFWSKILNPLLVVCGCSK